MTKKPETVKWEDLNRRLDGLYREGLHEYFHDNGQLRFRENFKNGKRHGLWEYFDEEGNLIKSENWNKGRLWGTDYWKNGKLVDSEIPF